MKHHGNRTNSAGNTSSALLSDEGLDFPDFFIDATLDASRKSGAIISFRAGQAPNLHRGHRVSPKPASLKIKTCSIRQGIKILAGFVPVDQETFGRAGQHIDGASDALQSVRNTLSHQNRQEEAEKFSAVPLEVTFNDIYSGSRLGMYSLFAVREQGKNAPDSWEFTPIAAANNEFIQPDPDRRQLIFRVKRGARAALDDEETFLPVEYKKPGHGTFVPLELFAYEGWPVTGDVDMLAVATPLSAVDMLGEKLLDGFDSSDLYKSYDVSDTCQLRELAVIYLLIRHAMNGVPVSRAGIGEQEIKVIMDSAAVRGSGMITPYELLVLMMSHEKLSKSYRAIAPGSENLIRHGAETCNPGKLSDLNTQMLHIRNGEMTVTHNERELVNFYLQPGLLEKNFLAVHPRWNMSLWSPVIQRQLALGQGGLINSQTFKNFSIYLQRQNETLAEVEHKNTGEIFSSIGSEVAKPEVVPSPAAVLEEKHSVMSAKNDTVIIEDVSKRNHRL